MEEHLYVETNDAEVQLVWRISLCSRQHYTVQYSVNNLLNLNQVLQHHTRTHLNLTIYSYKMLSIQNGDGNYHR